MSERFRPSEPEFVEPESVEPVELEIPKRTVHSPETVEGIKEIEARASDAPKPAGGFHLALWRLAEKMAGGERQSPSRELEGRSEHSTLGVRLFRFFEVSIENFIRRAMLEGLRLLLRDYAVAFDALVRRTGRAA